MYLKKLALKNVRNLVSADFEPAPGVNLVVGPNGAGKSTLLESIYVLSVGKSFRDGPTSNLIRVGEEASKLKAVLCEPDGDLDLDVSLSSRSRTVSINGEKVRRLTDFFGKLLVVSFSPDDILIYKGGPALRRKLMDKAVVDLFPLSIAAFSKYKKALQQKSVLLKNSARYPEVSAWNKILSETAAVISHYRLKMLDLVKVELQTVYSELTGSGELVNVRYESSLMDNRDAKSIEILLEKGFSREMAARRTLHGPHLDDFIFEINGLPIRGFSSQGQIRSLALAVKFSFLRIVRQHCARLPILLLDDVDSELDDTRKISLFQSLSSDVEQVFISAASVSPHFEALGSGLTKFTVDSGMVS